MHEMTRGYDMLLQMLMNVHWGQTLVTRTATTMWDLTLAAVTLDTPSTPTAVGVMVSRKQGS